MGNSDCMLRPHWRQQDTFLFRYMNIKIICVGGLKEPFLRDAARRAKLKCYEY